ncbi:MAG: hypothetical protein R6W99_08395 [Clostridia bacterium]
MSFFEIIMLICFGAAWPISILKSYRARTAAGKSPLFMMVVMTGYMSGMLHKWFFSRDFVILLYAVNFIMISVDLMLWFRNKHLDRQGSNNIRDLKEA